MGRKLSRIQYFVRVENSEDPNDALNTYLESLLYRFYKTNTVDKIYGIYEIVNTDSTC